MTATKKRTTVYLSQKVHTALKIKSAETGKSVSDILEVTAHILLNEDEEDLRAFREREKEDTVEYEDFLTDLKKNGIL